MNPLVIVELVLKIVLVAMEGQPADVREAIWRRHIDNLEKMDKFWNKLLHLDKEP
jgi:hypothetical protein